MKYLERLWQLADQEAQRQNTTLESVFAPIGLAIHYPLVDGGYDPTPYNSKSFAQTGMDGVHFNLLEVNGRVKDDSPVVMTVPMAAQNPNIVLGSNLWEFLCIGADIGYLHLGQISYDLPAALEMFQNPPALTEEQAYLLDILRQEFDLRPWPTIERRLEILRSHYLPLLIFTLR